jgi:hypothetical protein
MRGRYKAILIIAIAYLISSSAAFVAPFVEDNQILWIVFGAIFWAFLLLGSTLFLFLPKPRPQKDEKRIKLPSILKFFRNRFAMGADIALFLSIIANIVFAIFPISKWIHGSAMFLLILSFEMHMVFNSERYLNIKRTNGSKRSNHTKNRRALENV